ncbi:acyltransferase family protein [Kineococcus sp. DHX-1]|uniref:acyltransferase family protein n=1 Tax=Kineococcus sp. DHX-1 TaxID=3349638 RepID=UPI0036D2B58E
MAVIRVPHVDVPLPVARPAFRPDVEGLRAVALGCVLLFHAGVPFARGGNVGVDVFFVVSGFLITCQLVRELSATGRVDLPAFYARRARRILPSAAAVLVLTLAGTALVAPELLDDTGRAAVASALQAANWWSLSAGDLHVPLTHYWSLAVEEQFYLGWPVLLLLARRRPLVALGVLSAVSYGASVLLTPGNELLAYLGTGTRVWQFGLGAALALLAPRTAEVTTAHPGMTSRIRWAAAGVLVSAVVWAGWVDYPGWAALVPTLAAALLVGAGTSDPASGPGRLLLWRPVRLCGRISYTWYLWHVPATFFAVTLFPAVDRWPFLLLVELLAGGLAFLTTVFVEDPLRRSRFVASTRRGLVLGGAVTAVSLGAAMLAVA